MTEHVHSWYTGALDPDDPAVTICTGCGEYHLDHKPAISVKYRDLQRIQTCGECGQQIKFRPGNTLRPGFWLPHTGRPA